MSRAKGASPADLAIFSTLARSKPAGGAQDAYRLVCRMDHRTIVKTFANLADAETVFHRMRREGRDDLDHLALETFGTQGWQERSVIVRSLKSLQRRHCTLDGLRARHQAAGAVMAADRSPAGRLPEGPKQRELEGLRARQQAARAVMVAAARKPRP